MEAIFTTDDLATAKSKEKEKEEAANKMKITNGIGNINIKNIWDI